MLSSVVEPVLYLLSIGFGVGALVGKVAGVDVRYAAFVAPAILATTAMNAAFNQTCFAVFSRMKMERSYDAIVPTPLSVADIALGEVVSAVIGGLLPCVGFVVVMAALGLVVSPGIVLAIPGALLVGYAFAAAGLAVTTYLRDFSDFQLIQLVMLPMFLFATTFYPLSVYPGWAAAGGRDPAALPEHPAPAGAGARHLPLGRRRRRALPGRLRLARARARHAAADPATAAVTTTNACKNCPRLAAWLASSLTSPNRPGSARPPSAGS